MSTFPGAGIWLGLAVALGLWLILTATLGRRRLPGVMAMVHWWLSSWLGRIVLLALWAEAGFHVFGQHP